MNILIVINKNIMVHNEGIVYCDNCCGEGSIILNMEGDWETCETCDGDGFL